MAPFLSSVTCVSKMGKRKFISPAATGGTTRRKPGGQPQRPVVLIVCEGHTEETYFSAVKATYRNKTAVNIQIKRDCSDPFKLVEKAIQLNREGDYDLVFCVLDGDRPDRVAMARARIGKRGGVDLVLSTPCFEVWLLLHLVRSDAPFTECAAVCARLREHLPDYVKGAHYDFAPLLPEIDQAIDNAQWLAGLGRNSPATEVHRLLTSLKAHP